MNEIVDSKYRSAEEIEHTKHISENYRKLVDSASPLKEREPERTYEAPARQERPAAPGHVLREGFADNAARFADYVAHPAPARGKTLFEDAKYGQNVSYMRPSAPVREEAPVRTYPAPAKSRTYEAVRPAPAVEYDEADALPTQRTMDTLRGTAPAIAEREEEGVGFFAALTMKMKIALAAVFTAIVIALVIVCVNSAVLNSLNSDISGKRSELNRLMQNVRQAEQRVDDLLDDDNIAGWAQEHGLVRD